jgi:hypothetical protein
MSTRALSSSATSNALRTRTMRRFRVRARAEAAVRRRRRDAQAAIDLRLWRRNANRRAAAASGRRPALDEQASGVRRIAALASFQEGGARSLRAATSRRRRPRTRGAFAFLGAQRTRTLDYYGTLSRPWHVSPGLNVIGVRRPPALRLFRPPSPPERPNRSPSRSPAYGLSHTSSMSASAWRLPRGSPT